jgi:DNA adenine methylase
VAPGTSARLDVTKLQATLEEVHERLSRVVIERLPFDQLIARYDRPGTLFYLDPPYWGCEKDYGPGVFGREDFERLAQQLAGIKGCFLLSLNDTPGVRQGFRAFEIEEVEITCGISGKQQKASEVLIASRAR